jgi:hypothetical protein
VKPALVWTLASAAGFLGWRAVASGPPPSRAATPRTIVVPAAPPQTDDGPDVPALRRRLALVRSVPPRELVLYGKEPPSARIRRARALPEKAKWTLLEWMRRAVYDRELAGEILGTIRDEEDRENLAWLAWTLDQACLTKLTEDPTFLDDEKRAMVPLALRGEPFVILPGSALARAIRSLMLLAGTEGWTLTICGTSTTSEMGAKSRTASYGIFAKMCGLMVSEGWIRSSV